MLNDKPKFIGLTLLFLAATAAGAGDLAHGPAMNGGPKSSPPGQQWPATAKPNDAAPRPPPGRMFVVGRVLDQNGKPVPGATVAVHARSLPRGRVPYFLGRRQIPIGDARTDGSGRFRIDAPRTSSSHDEAFGAVALAPGHGAGWVTLDPDDEEPTAEMSLRPEQVIHGLDPDTETPVYFLEPKRKLGTVVNLSGKSAASGSVTVRLEPCGAAKARVVDPGGKPVMARSIPGTIIMRVTMVVTPGPPFSRASEKAGVLVADDDSLDRVDPSNYASEPVSDASGRITLPVLIPGATYRFIDYTTAVRGETGPALRKEFTVKPGETVDLGDIRIEKPAG